MAQTEKTTSRKKFLLWSTTILSSVAFFKILPTPQEEKETVKMLTQDGNLVEVDASRLTGRKEKINDEQLKKWVIKK